MIDCARPGSSKLFRRTAMEATPASRTRRGMNRCVYHIGAASLLRRCAITSATSGTSSRARRIVEPGVLQHQMPRAIPLATHRRRQACWRMERQILTTSLNCRRRATPTSPHTLIGLSPGSEVRTRSQRVFAVHLFDRSWIAAASITGCTSPATARIDCEADRGAAKLQCDRMAMRCRTEEPRSTSGGRLLVLRCAAEDGGRGGMPGSARSGQVEGASEATPASSSFAPWPRHSTSLLLPPRSPPLRPASAS